MSLRQERCDVNLPEDVKTDDQLDTTITVY
jgi:hypothetical protein